ncbi:hypothetical protein ST47_g6193 [Ascochyta rabiei]|uniref:Uncharacterized protein n=1 Tax=Didymella rabiei TaxID=5454 RepID=A0A163CRF9_DIDRA|nr:hypothetical protein ST47_g6193 [Ascochyta rabiei]
MDIGSFYAPSAERHRMQSGPQASDNSNPKPKARPGDTRKAMVDNKGWRKKIGGKPKELPPINTTSDETAVTLPLELPAAVDSTERRRHGWRKTMAASRPATPITPAPPTPTPEDIEDTRSERTDDSAPRRDSKPKPIRYTSLFTTHKEEPSGPDFAEPWSVDAPPSHDQRAYVDPVVVMECIHSHLCKNYMVPVPLEYNSGLFQIFDDYRKLRSQKERLDMRERKMLDDSCKLKDQWFEAEGCYEAEIHRLELLIARGITGSTRLMKARQGTVVDRKREHRKIISTDRYLPQYLHMSPTKIDEEIKLKSHQVLLNRPTSLSGRMTALSRQLTHTGLSELPVGTPPRPDRESALSRKVKSELNMTDLHYAGSSDTLSNSVTYSSTLPMDPAPEEVTSDESLLLKDIVECDAFIALKELGVLVARRKGLDVSYFVNGLMSLLTSRSSMKTDTDPRAHECETHSPAAKGYNNVSADDSTPRPPLRMPRSGSQQPLDQGRPRHFSFEPGDDQMRDVEAGFKTYDSLSQTDSTDSETTSSSAASRVFAGVLQTNDNLIPLSSSSGTDVPTPSMIPSPVQTTARVRRENSTSSLRSIFVKNIKDDRHSSRTSVQTAFREAPCANASVRSKSKSSSNHNLRAAESPLGSKERLDSLANRHSTAALAAARAAEGKSNNSSQSNTRSSVVTSSSQKLHTAEQRRSENSGPRTRNDARKSEVE